ncbi:NAD(P)/FAD-dependent oxidoreductase [Saccharopolyspora taberi]|uniref:FAD-dependent oxidoreductase n=1 Tax=Saccharopolyspora taberi TaxID=60895 RepID=A0ABN3V321_9PSEU
MAHRIVVLGAGYAGLTAARRLADGFRRGDVRITLVNATPEFVERVRLHQTAAGQQIRPWPLRDSLRDTGIELLVGRVVAVDPVAREVRLDDGRTTGYDKLVYALGSTDDDSVPGVAEHALKVAGHGGAVLAGARIAELAAAKGTVAVVGGGATGIEAAAELAESHPDLRVRMLVGPELGAQFSRRGREHVQRVFDRLGIEVRAGAQVGEVRSDHLVLSGGGTVEADAALWTAGFRVSPLAAESGVECDERGRIVVDPTMRSVSHPDVYAIGDAARARSGNGTELRMSCATGLPMAMRAAKSIIAELGGATPAPMWFRYFNLCVSLGRRDALIQFLNADDSPRPAVLTGRTAVLYKEAIVRGAAWVVRRSPRLWSRQRVPAAARSHAA